MDLGLIDNVLWDWNGTLFDDGDISFELNEKIFSKYGCTLSAKELRKRFVFPVSKYVLSLNLNANEQDYKDMHKSFKSMFLDAMPKITLAKGAMEILEFFSKSDKTQYVLSSAPEDVLIPSLDHYKVAQYFKDIACNKPGYGGSIKQQLATDLVAKNAIDPKRTLYIGDTDHDGHVADHIGCQSILVSWGHQTPDVVKSTKYSVVDSFKELQNLFQI